MNPVQKGVLGAVLITAAIIAAIIYYPSAGRKELDRQGAAARVVIVTTLFPLYDFAGNIGRERVDVSLLLPPGVEAHAYEPKPSDIARISSADLFVYTGNFMEPWVGDVLKGIHSPKLKVVDCSKGVTLFRQEHPGEGHSPDHEGEHYEHEHGHSRGVDPHIWLDLGNARKMSASIAAALVEIDPGGRETYEANARAYDHVLSSLDGRYRETLSSCPRKEFIHGGHYAFGYLARRYNLHYIAAQGFSPDSEPTPRQLAAMTRTIREHSLKYIFTEELVEPRVARTLSRETGAEVLTLHGAHNISREELEGGRGFAGIMEQNLENLRKALGCGQ
ncbi:MAG: metal ABC transporter substrate-binding protein [Desulfobacterota bacterium]|jgi:zinc transport system substrate-binding protein|nr:metal ABC transporter substrate-binding protein [Thermodesulfobacteriota bacterium]